VLRYAEHTVLDGLSLRVAAGERVALVGESGVGKTTLLRTFNRMVEPQEGTVRVGGRDVRKLNPVRLRRSMGYVQQEGGLLPHWTILRNAALVPWLRRMDDAEGLARRALERVGMPAAVYGARLPRELSGGQRQRVALARALAAHPEIVLLDEPFGALDAITRSELSEAVGRLFLELEVSALLVTHDLHGALAFADRIAVLRAGRVEQIADPETLCCEPETDYVRTLLTRAGVEVRER